MANWERELARLLDREKTLLKSIDEYSAKKTDILAKGDVDTLNKIVDNEQSVVLQLQAAETRREELLKNNNLGGKTLADICRIAGLEYKIVLETDLVSLRDITNKIKKRNTLNNKLTKSRLEFYGKMRAALTKPVYGYDGILSQKINDGMSLIDRKI